MEKNILLTGSHRSGSTWTGKVLAKARRVRYIHEPFNPGIKRINSPITHWYEHLDGGSSIQKHKANQYLASFLTVLNRQNLKRFFALRNKEDIYRLYTDLKGSFRAKRALIKDPIALMSADWIYQNYNWNIVVLIRHPAAFIASIKAQNWEFDFKNFLQQTSLMDEHLGEYSSVLKEYSENRKDIVEQGILLWNVLYNVISHYKEQFGKQWYFVRHEDISKQPIQEFGKMFSFLGLSLDKNVIDYIKRTSESDQFMDLERNSRENIKLWKKRLSMEEIEFIKKGTERIWSRFYSDEDW